MSSRSFKLIFIILLAVAVQAVAVAQQKSEPPPQKDYVESTGFKGRIFEIKYRDPGEIYRTVLILGSGFKGATVTYNPELKTITVRDFPENIATIEEAIKRLDIPRPARSTEPDAEIQVDVLIASNEDLGGNPQPAALKDVVKQLQNTLGYKNYNLLTTIIHRAKLQTSYASSYIITSLGRASLRVPNSERPSSINYEMHIRQVSPEAVEGTSQSLVIRDFNFTVSPSTNVDRDFFGEAKVSTNLTVRDGERVVVGTASMKDKGMILVLTARVVK